MLQCTFCFACFSSLKFLLFFLLFLLLLLLHVNMLFCYSCLMLFSWFAFLSFIFLLSLLLIDFLCMLLYFAYICFLFCFHNKEWKFKYCTLLFVCNVHLYCKLKEREKKTKTPKLWLVKLLPESKVFQVRNFTKRFRKMTSCEF